MSNPKTSAIESLEMGNPLPLSYFFAPAGPVAQALKNFEPRKQQEEMAAAVYNAITEKKHLIVEAGTGVGKSLAYLLPLALWAVQNKKKVVAATYTKALQGKRRGKRQEPFALDDGKII